MTECRQEMFEFRGQNQRRVEARFDAGHVTSDAGVLLVREAAVRSGTLQRFSQCFEDRRDPCLIEHTVEELLAQRVYGLACGYEDLNDHDRLRPDPAFALAAGKEDVEGKRRARTKDRGKGIAGKSTLNRLELSQRRIPNNERYKKSVETCRWWRGYRLRMARPGEA